MKIAVYGMGSIYVPDEITRGAVIATGEYKVDIIRTVPESLLKKNSTFVNPLKTELSAARAKLNDLSI